VGAQFVGVSDGGVVDLTSIKPIGYDYDTYKGGSINVQTLDAGGKMIKGSKYFWYDDDDGTAWFDGDDEEVVAGQVTFKPGDALWSKANSATEGFQSSGAVATGSIDVYLREGFKLVNNPTPVAIPFNDDGKGKFIAVSGYNYDTYKGGSINAQKLDAGGKMVKGSKFFWYDDDDGTAWFDGDDEEVEGVSLNPGEALWIKANATNEKLTFPSAL